MMSLFSQCLEQKRFCILVEYLCSKRDTLAVTQSLAGFPAMMTLADRVHSDEDPAPLELAQRYSSEIEKLLHFSGKGRDIKEFEHFLDQAEQQGYHNLLLLTGDKLKNHNFGREIPAQRSRYLESVSAVMAAKQRNVFNIGVAFNPFKYTEAERDAQYLKLHKKIKAGADFLITQLGFDLDCLQHSQSFISQNYNEFPLIACVMPLTLKRAQFMVKNQIAGLVIAPHIVDVLEREYAADPVQAEANVYARCALQILLCKHLGYVGVHLSACHKPQEQQKLEQFLKQFENWSLEACEKAWKELWKMDSGLELKPELSTFSKPVSQIQILKYKKMHLMHHIFFASQAALGVGRFIFKANFWNKPRPQHLLLKMEHWSKQQLVGCESCGHCRLDDTLYICPETCPKGLANGPCGGTTLDRCEFGDRECIHSVKARLAKSIDQTEVLRSKLIPAISIETRYTSSWKNWFRNSDLN
ncbi:methylenetetrahydrofolate reductase [Acinetobacter sp. NRRL B-65365]|nr:methylenetetrahydrofolate reductase [Acinetobacter sp. NRRL B-65365]